VIESPASEPVAAPTPAGGCPACGGPTGRTHEAAEMMFGTRDRFTYVECDGCGCLRLADPPADLGRYYPANYYSFTAPLPPVQPIARPGLRAWGWRKRVEAVVFGRRGVWGWAARRWPPYVAHPEAAAYFRGLTHLGLDARVLDVGCGRGHFLVELANLGFRRLTGADPYLPADLSPAPGVRILAAPLSALAGRRFDIIFLHHSLEHIADQRGTLEAVARALDPKGVAVVRVPVAGTRPWRTYGTDWAELDAPRHLVIHTERSLRRLAGECGFRVDRVEYDADPFAYWGSELYRSGVSLYDPAARGHRRPADHFPADRLAEFDRQTAADNAGGDGGRAIFWVRLR
jgi:SAM-dependent methyltransferase